MAQYIRCDVAPASVRNSRRASAEAACNGYAAAAVIRAIRGLPARCLPCLRGRHQPPIASIARQTFPPRAPMFVPLYSSELAPFGGDNPYPMRPIFAAWLGPRPEP